MLASIAHCTARRIFTALIMAAPFSRNWEEIAAHSRRNRFEQYRSLNTQREFSANNSSRMTRRESFSANDAAPAGPAAFAAKSGMTRDVRHMTNRARPAG